MPLMCVLLPFSRTKTSFSKWGDPQHAERRGTGAQRLGLPLPLLVGSSTYDGGEAGERAGETDEERVGGERWVRAASGLHAHDLRKSLLGSFGERENIVR